MPAMTGTDTSLTRLRTSVTCSSWVRKVPSPACRTCWRCAPTTPVSPRSATTGSAPISPPATCSTSATTASGGQRPPYASTARNREAGYRDALADAGVPVDETLLAGDSLLHAAGELAGRTLLDRPDRPTAIFAVNDNNAIGVMAAAHALGLRIPDDLSLVGYNDIPVVSRLPVPLTTVRVPFGQSRPERSSC